MDLKEILPKLKEVSRKLQLMEDSILNEILLKLAENLEKNNSKILEANEKDLEKIDRQDPIYDRIMLDKKRISDMASSLRVIAGYESPVGEIVEEKKLENGLKLRKITVPFGVIGVIFEARPNVIIDVFAICFKSKNACVLKGGSQAEASYGILMENILEVLKEYELQDCALLLPNDQKLIEEMLKADDYIDVIIPRGGAGLIKFVRENSRVPVIETGAGVVHIYFDETGDKEMARNIVYNAKTQRPSVCNAMDTLIIHENSINDLGEICQKLAEKEVQIFADEPAYEILLKTYPKQYLEKAQSENFGKEYLSLKMSIKTVPNIEEAIKHINKYGSGHSESIITENKKSADKFLEEIDAAAVYVNASTRFTDGGVFGLGAEIGISTQKLHARGPMGIKELTSYKWQITGNGQVR